jgi:hypothetical protein
VFGTVSEIIEKYPENCSWIFWNLKREYFRENHWVICYGIEKKLNVGDKYPIGYYMCQSIEEQKIGKISLTTAVKINRTIDYIKLQIYKNKQLEQALSKSSRIHNFLKLVSTYFNIFPPELGIDNCTGETFVILNKYISYQILQRNK